MKKIIPGVLRFQEEQFPQRKKLFESLAKGQAPRALFITCADSRVDPNLITQTEPGELFILRNAGNIVPPHTNHSGGMTASIEYAVGALNVRHVIVCGHSGCGAMQGAMAPENLAAFPHVRNWLGHVQAARMVVDEQGQAETETEMLEALIRQNVILQLDHLRTHPYVAARLATNRLHLHGWVYDIAHGGVTVYEPEHGGFVPVEQHYTEGLLTQLDPAPQDGTEP